MTEQNTHDPVLAWHFLRDDRHLQYGRRTKPITVGETLTVKRKPVLCEWGLHASRRVHDALTYAPGNVICRVLVGGTIVEGYDKLAGTTRTVIAMIDAEALLREWACDCAERALTREREAKRETDPRCWQAIEVARKFSRGEATKEELAAAYAAAGDAAWAAAKDAEIEWQNAELERRVLAAMRITAETTEAVPA